MTTDIIVPVYNLLEYTKLFIDSIESYNDGNYHIIVIDNGSSDGTYDYLKSIKSNIEIIRNKENLGYVKAINQGLKICTSESILLANNDCLFTPNLLTNLQEGLKKYDLIGPLSNNVGDVSHPLLVEYKFDSIQGLIKFAHRLETQNKGKIRDIEYLYGHCLMMSRHVFESLGYLDERYGLGNYDDRDYCERALKEGFRIGLRKDSFIYHFCHTTFNKMNIDVEELINKNEKIFNKKWLKHS